MRVKGQLGHRFRAHACKPAKKQVELGRSGVQMSAEGWDNFRIQGWQTQYTQMIDWVSYWEERIIENMKNGSSEENILFLRDKLNMLS